jgi:hypothetical protein
MAEQSPLVKPVLLFCSAAIHRTEPAADFIARRERGGPAMSGLEQSPATRHTSPFRL